MSGSMFPAGVPDARAPIVDGQGRMTQQFQRIVQALVGRTGGGSGSNTGALSNSVAAAATLATAAQSTASAGLALALIGDAPPPQPDQSTALLALFMGDVA